MADSDILRTGQEYLNQKAGFTGPLRTKQECLNSLAGYTDNTLTSNIAWNKYAGEVPGRIAQLSANVKAGTTGRTKQDASRLI